MSRGEARPLLVTARLASPIVTGDNDLRLDGLLEAVLSLHHGKGVPGYKVDRALPCPPQAAIPIPLTRCIVEGWHVAACSDPIYPECAAEYVEHFVKKLGVEHAPMLAPESRVVVSTTNSWTKSYRLPLRVRRVDRVCWFAVAGRRELLKVLRRVESLGKKRSYGYGRVAEWSIVEAERDASWFAPSPRGPVLMATLPAGPWLPDKLIGARRDFGSCVPPYWHPSRFCEIVRPC